MKTLIPYRQWLWQILILIVCTMSCKDSAVGDKVLPSNKVDFSKRITTLYTNPKDPLGLIMHVPEWKIDIMTFGTKNADGLLNKMNTMLFFNPANETWFSMDFKDKYPAKITSYTGAITQFSNYDRVKLTVDIIVKDAAGKTLKTINAYKLTEDYFLGFESTAKALSNSGARVVKVTKSECQKAKDFAQAVGFAANVVACAVGIMGIAESAGIVLIFDGIGLLSACYNALATVANKIDKKVFPGTTPLFAELSCSQSLGLDGVGIAGAAAGAGNISSVSGLVGLAASAAATASDVNACGECPPEDKPQAKSSGDPHIDTHDGDSFGFQGHGEFIVVKSTTDNFEIQARQEPFAGSLKATVNTAVAIKTTTNDVVCVVLNPKMVYVNKIALADAFGSKTLSDGSTLTQATDGSVRLDTKQGDIVVVKRFFDSWLDYSVSLPAARVSKVKGLMGNFDGVLVNDIALSDGRVIEPTFANLYPTYADSWRITQATSLFVYDAGKTTTNYTNRNFPTTDIQLTTNQIDAASKTCKAAGVTGQPYLNNCIYDVAVSGNSAFTASALNAQDFSYTATVPGGTVGSDVNYYQNVRLEITNGSQSDLTQLNLIDWASGKVYALKDGAANAAKIDIAALSIAGHLALYPVNTLKSCGSSCGVGSINSVIDSQKWTVSRKGTVEFKPFSKDETTANPNFVPIAKWATLKTAADLQALHQPLNLNINETLVYALLVEAKNSNNPDTPLSASVCRFITQEGKRGGYIVTGFGKIANTEKYYVTIDIKIEK